MSGTPIEALDLAALLCSRVCHDLISPVGAIVNGLEVLDEAKDEETKNFAFELIKKSARTGSAKLQFCRIAFGAAGSAGAQIDLGDAEAISRGRYRLELFTGKAKIEQRLRDLRQQGRFDNVVFARPGFYWQNFTAGLFKPTKQPDGSFVYAFPTDPAKTPVCCLDISDFGAVVARILLNPQIYADKFINISAECLTLTQIVGMIGEAAGKRVTAKQISEEEALRSGMAPEYVDMFKFFRDFGYYGDEKISQVGRELHPGMKDFRTFLRSSNEWRQLFA